MNQSEFDQRVQEEIGAALDSLSDMRRGGLLGHTESRKMLVRLAQRKVQGESVNLLAYCDIVTRGQHAPRSSGAKV